MSWCEGMNMTDNLYSIAYYNIKNQLLVNGKKCLANGGSNYVSTGMSYFYIQKIRFGFNPDSVDHDDPERPYEDTAYTDCWLVGARRTFRSSDRASFFGRQESDDKRMIVMEYSILGLSWMGIGTNCICLDPNNQYITKLNYNQGSEAFQEPWALLPCTLYDFDFDFDEMYNSLPSL